MTTKLLSDENKQPTQKQIKELWEWCGFNPSSGVRGWWVSPDGRREFTKLPDLDLNNIFKYAVPKLEKDEYYICLETHKSYGHRGLIEYRAWTEYIPKSRNFALIENPDPVLALFCPIMEVIHAK